MDSDDAYGNLLNNMEKQSTSFPRKLKQDKGVAGLTILLSVVAMVFIIGFLVMIFAVIGGSLAGNVDTPTSATVTGETGAFFNATGYTVARANSPGFTSFSVTSAINSTSGLLIASPNYTVSQTGTVTNATAIVWSAVTLNYTYVYDANNTATQTITQTTTSLATIPTWFPIIITITVMVALILLTVIIIVAIRSSGILAGGN